MLQKFFFMLLFACGFMQVLGQKQLPSDESLKALELKYLKTGVTKTTGPDGETYLQRNFSEYLHAMQDAQQKLGQMQANDYGHDHTNDRLETFLNRPHPSAGTLEKYFTSAAKTWQVPASLLRAWAQVQSNWAQVSESMYGSWGIMGLIENGQTQQISLAAALLKTTPDDIKNNAKTNIMAAAALLRHYAGSQLQSTQVNDWFAAACKLTGIPEAALQVSLTQRVYHVLAEGSKTISMWGEIIYLPPVGIGVVPDGREVLEQNPEPVLQGGGTPDYPGAILNYTTCNFNARPAGAGINFYFVHYIATGTYEGTISWFKNCSAQASAHYVVRNSDGQITQMVDEADRAWTQGVTLYNDQGIGVEHEVLATNLAMWDSEPMLREAGKLAADVCNRNSIPKTRRTTNGEKGIYGHSDVRATDCPNLTTTRWNTFLTQVATALPAVGIPTLLQVMAAEGSDAVTAVWRANSDPTLLGYRLYYATNDGLNSWALAANETTLTPSTTTITLQPSQFLVVPKDPVYHFRLTAVVPNGEQPVVESGASDVYARSHNGSGPRVLIVDAFDRSTGSYRGSTHPFAASYFRALRSRANLQISTVANETIEEGTVSLLNYDIVVWFTGDESSANVVFSAQEKSAISTFLTAGGKLLLSGSEIAFNIGRSAASTFDPGFMNAFLKANYVNDGAANYTPATGTAGTSFQGLTIPFGIVYPEDFPDAISPFGGAIAILDYAVTPATNKAGIAYEGLFGAGVKEGAIVYLAFPLETASDPSMSALTGRILSYFDIPVVTAPPVAVPDEAVVQAGGGKRIYVLANDQDFGTSLNVSSVSIVTPPANGTAVPQADGTIIYHPAAGFSGADVFTYRVSNSNGNQSNAAGVTLTITPADTDCRPGAEKDDNFPLRELRGAWVTTVFNLDWPSSRTISPAQQQAELTRIFDTLKNTGFNTIFFQVRTGSDALYQSPYEPWSYYLTNVEGQAPAPLWDPLQFAIDEAHKRGLELHAWLNPYRARTGSYTLSPTHVINQQPSWILTIGTNLILNPGLPSVRNYISNIVADIANRYDVDGIHFDDYFYPSTTTTEDNATYAAHNPAGIPNIQDWRRDNVNRMIAQVYDTLVFINQQQNRNIVFGVSPFGIWKSGTPAGISGQSSFSALYCDPIAWMQAGKVDYLAPQLYWRITGAQDYNILSQWWNDQGKQFGRTIYTGHAWYKMIDTNNWPASEIEEQIKLNRLPVRNEIMGEIGYRTGQITANSKNLKNVLQQGLYRYKSIPPPYRWKDSICPNPPARVRFEGDTLRWDAPAPAADGDIARRYVVYRFEDAGLLPAMTGDGSKVMDIVSGNRIFIPDGAFSNYVVTALDDNNNESVPAMVETPNITLCPGGSAQLPALVAGTTHQWQMQSEGVWENIVPGPHFTGTQTPTLGLVNMPVSFYGKVIRCLANGSNAGPLYTLRFGSTWTAGQNANWSNGVNWSCGSVPNLQTDAIIRGGITPFPVVDIPNAEARSVILRTGAEVHIMPGMHLRVDKQ